MQKTLDIVIRPESSILAKYKETDYKIESVLSEFIDNSTQSYFDHRKELNDIGINTCLIEISIFPEYIEIIDNAYGMGENDFRRALKLDSPPEDTSGRNERGMGLKTAATYLGSEWSVSTAQYNSGILYEAVMDIDLIQTEAPEKITAHVYDINKDQHFTKISIRKLNQKITPGKIKKVIDTIGEMFARDIKNGDAKILINKQPLRYESPEIRHDENGDEYIKYIDRTFSYEGQNYTFSGWAGIRKKGDTQFSGLTLMHKGRAVIMNYRPKELLGAPNTYPYQRIIGEIDMGDEWPISHTKDAFVWDGGLEDAFIAELKKKDDDGIGELITIATKLRKWDSTKADDEKAVKDINKTFKNFNTTPIPQVNLLAEPEITPTPQVKPVEEPSKPKDNEVHITYAGIDYVFEILEGINYTERWLKIENTEDPNRYVLKLNYDIPFFHEMFTNSYSEKNHRFLDKMAVSIALSYVTSKSFGCKDGHVLINMLNTVISNAQ